MMVIRFIFFYFFKFFFQILYSTEKTNNYQVLLQGFWWDYYNLIITTDIQII